MTLGSAALAIGFALLLLGGPGCVHTSSAVQAGFNAYDRVAILGQLDEKTQQSLQEAWRHYFPTQTLVERRELAAAVGEQNLAVERLDEATRLKLRQALGIKALVFPNLAIANREWFAANATTRLALRVVDTQNGHIVASAWCDGSRASDGLPLANQILVKQAVANLRAEARSAK